MPADDLPAELELLFSTDSGPNHRWTLIGRNEKAHEQEKPHPELNAVHRLWHCPIARNRSVFKLEFTRPVRKGDNVFHIYLKADGDEHTGRRHEGIHNGVDYMFTLTGGDPTHPSSGLGVFEANGRSRGGTCSAASWSGMRPSTWRPR